MESSNLLRKQLEQQTLQTRQALAQLMLVREQLISETNARVEAQVRSQPTGDKLNNRVFCSGRKREKRSQGWACKEMKGLVSLSQWGTFKLPDLLSPKLWSFWSFPRSRRSVATRRRFVEHLKIGGDETATETNLCCANVSTYAPW